MISFPITSELLVAEIRRRQCRVPTDNNIVGTRHVQSPLYHSGVTRIDMIYAFAEVTEYEFLALFLINQRLGVF